MDLIDLFKIIGLAAIFVLVPLIWIVLRGERSGDPEDAHWDYNIMEDTNRFGRGFYRAIISPLLEWFKIRNEGDVRWLLTSNPIRLTIAYSLLEGPVNYNLLYEKVRRKLEDVFELKVSEISYDYHFDWLVDAKVIQRTDEYYHLAPLPADIIELVNKKFRMKMKV